jgi:hypothetical protein
VGDGYTIDPDCRSVCADIGMVCAANLLGHNEMEKSHIINGIIESKVLRLLTIFVIRIAFEG